MGKIVVSDNVSLDGVVQDPAGDEGFRVGGGSACSRTVQNSIGSRSTRPSAPRPCC
jgi:hypothetical protein